MSLFSRRYVFLTISLPPLEIGSKPEISFDQFKNLLKDNLSASDYNQTVILRRYYDILNFRAMLRGEPLDSHGNLDENELREAVIDVVNLPKYALDFLDKYESKKDRLAHFSELIAAYFKEEQKNAKGFLKKYLAFERELRFMMVAFRAKALGKDVAVELQREDPNEEIIAQILAQKDAKEFDPPDPFRELKTVFEKFYDRPLELYQAILAYVFQAIDEMEGSSPFSFDLVMGYMVRLIAIERWGDLDRQKGLKVVENILKESS